MTKKVAVIGCTGFIGQLCLEVLENLNSHYSIKALAAGNNIEVLNSQIRRINPEIISIKDYKNADYVKKSDQTILLSGIEGLLEIMSNPEIDLVIIATSGEIGLLPTIKALEAKKTIVISNKEALVMGGEVLREKVLETGTLLRPVDIEHNAIWQCCTGEKFSIVKSSPCALVPLNQDHKFERLNEIVSRIILPASGGPFYDFSISDLKIAKASQLLNDPTWKSVSKITVDSATMINKAMEVMECFWLFGIPYEQIDVFVHRESMTHGMVEFYDGNIRSKIGTLDMRFPIQHALTFPERIKQDIKYAHINLEKSMTFKNIDCHRYPAFNIGVEAGKLGGTYPSVLCAADEVAVEHYLRDSIGFLDIPCIIESTLELHNNIPQPNINDILDAYEWGVLKAREVASRFVKG